MMNQESPEHKVQATRIIRDYLRLNPAATPTEIVDWLRQNGIEMSSEAVGATLAAIKTG